MAKKQRGRRSSKRGRKQDSSLCLIGGLWWNESKDGDEYLAGYLGASRILIFDRKHESDSDNPPDMMLYVAPDNKRSDDSDDDDLEDD